MTTRVRIENAGPSAIHVRTVPTEDEAGHNAATRLDPGQSSEFFYVHRTQNLKVEESASDADATAPHDVAIPVDAVAVVPGIVTAVTVDAKIDAAAASSKPEAHANES